MSRRYQYGHEDRRQQKDRRWFFPGQIENRGKKSLPFTTREPDFKPIAQTVRRANDPTKQGE